MSLEDKFNAAVNVIRSLPKRGTFQPSNELMLRFYSFYKQATEGPCDKQKPGFWDVVNRAKWEAWNRLGDMTRDEAMQAYVKELYKIVETMSYTEDIASFLSAGDNDDEDIVFPTEDLELVAGDILSRARSERNSPNDSCSISPAGSPPRATSPTMGIRHDGSEDEYTDTMDVSVVEVENAYDNRPSSAHGEHEQLLARQRAYARLGNGHAHQISHQISSQLTHLRVLEELPGTLARLERDVAALRKAVEGDRTLREANTGWRWPWQEFSPGTLLFVVLWPIVAVRVASYIQRRRAI